MSERPCKAQETVKEKILGGNFLRRVGKKPKPINTDALKKYIAKYCHLIRDDRVRANIDAAVAKL